MVVTPFQDTPEVIFKSRMVTPMVLVFVFFFFIAGGVRSWMGFSSGSGSNGLDFLSKSIEAYGIILTRIGQIPGVCIAGNTLNDFQAHQCQVYWNELGSAIVAGAIPFGAVGLAFFLVIDNFKTFYKKLRKRTEQGKAISGGIVTHPAEAPANSFSWFYCFRPITIELPNQSQLKVYASFTAEAPKPGQRVAVFEPFTVFGEKRYFIVPYNPHVAVVRGE